MAELEARSGIAKPPRTAEDDWQAYKQNSWGTGFPKLAEQVGGAATDLAAKVLPAERTHPLQYLIPTAPEVGAVANMATNALPQMASSYRPQGEQLKPALEGLSKWLMQSSVKPSLADRASGASKRAIQTMLDEGINPTPGGMDKTAGLVKSLNEEVKAGIANSGASVPTANVRDFLQKPYTAARQQVNPAEDMQTIRNVWSEFEQHPDIKGAQDISVQLAQALKSGTYKALGNKSYGELGSASTEAQKAIARGLREEVLGKVPEIAEPLKREAALMNVREVALNRSLGNANKDPMGFASWRMDDPKLAATILADRSALVKSLLARGLYQGSRPNVVAPLGVAGGFAAQQQQE